jgi:hypothetical protein
MQIGPLDEKESWVEGAHSDGVGFLLSVGPMQDD